MTTDEVLALADRVYAAAQTAPPGGPPDVAPGITWAGILLGASEYLRANPDDPKELAPALLRLVGP